jgi:hypothetical protein
MEELVQRVSAATGLEPETAHKAIGMVLNFMQKQITPEQSAAVLDKVPGAREAATGAAAESEGGGFGLMGLANDLTSAGLGMGQMQILGREMFAFLRQHAGEDAVGELAASIPGLHQFM